MSRKTELLEKLSDAKLVKLAREKDISQPHPFVGFNPLMSRRDYLIQDLSSSPKVMILEIQKYLTVKRKSKKEEKKDSRLDC
jgi:predicted ATP-grasp superfamily ATP-dependent carboligase